MNYKVDLIVTVIVNKYIYMYIYNIPLHNIEKQLIKWTHIKIHLLTAVNAYTMQWNMLSIEAFWLFA